MPETFEIPASYKEESKKRGKLLTGWLVLMLIVNAGAALTYLLWNSSIIAMYPNAPSWIFYIYGILGLANVVFTVFLFSWRKWAFFALCGSTGVGFILNLIIGLGLVVDISGLAGPVILYLILRSRWNLLE